jgi:hypothetical protein
LRRVSSIINWLRVVPICMVRSFAGRGLIV